MQPQPEEEAGDAGVGAAAAPVGASNRSSCAAFLGSMLFIRCVSGTRVVPRGQAKTVAGVDFTGYGASVTGYPHDYLTAACAVGLSAPELAEFSSRLDKAIRKAKGGEAKRDQKGNTPGGRQSGGAAAMTKSAAAAAEDGVGVVGMAGEACAGTAGSPEADIATTALLPTVDSGVRGSASDVRENVVASVTTTAAGSGANGMLLSNAHVPAGGGDGFMADRGGICVKRVPASDAVRPEASSGLVAGRSSANGCTAPASNGNVAISGSGVGGSAGSVVVVGNGNSGEDKADKIDDTAEEEWDNVD